MSYHNRQPQTKPARSVPPRHIPASWRSKESWLSKEPWCSKEAKKPEPVDHSRTTNLGPQLLNYLLNGTIALGNPNPKPNAGPRRVPLPVIPEDEWDPPSSLDPEAPEFIPPGFHSHEPQGPLCNCRWPRRIKICPP